MGVVYYKYKSEKEVYSLPLAHAFISAYELKQLILTSDRYGLGRTRGRGPTEVIAISNAQTGEDYTDENAMIPQNTTVLVRRIVGQLSENIVLVSSRKVTEGCSVASNKSVVTDSSSKSLSSTEVQDEDAAITAVIDAAELKVEGDNQSRNGLAGGRFASGSRYGHGPLEGETPPPGYVCRSCGVPGHFIQHCTQELKKPPPGYICYRCRIPGHFIQHCPTIGGNLDKNKMIRSLAPVVTPSPADGILESLVPSASDSAVDDLPAELHCQLCKKVMADAVLTSKCCFDSFCDKCIRDYIITQSKCICGAKVLADSLIPNPTLRSTIRNMLSTRAGNTTSGTTKRRSSSGSNPDPKLQSDAPSAASEREEMKQPMDHHVSEAAAPDGGLQVATKDDRVNQLREKLAANVDPFGKDEVSSAELSVKKAAANAENLKLQYRSESTSKVTTVSGTLEQNTTRTDQPKKRKKAGSTKIVQPNNADFGYNIPMDPAYYNPFVGGYPWAAEPYMYGSIGMPYGGYPMGPYGFNPMNSMPPHALPMNGYPPNYHRPEVQSTHQQGTGTDLRSRLSVRPKDTGIQSQSSECNRQRVSSHGSELRNRTRSSPERRDHRRSDRASDDYYEDHSRKRMRVASPIDGDKQSSRRSKHSSRSMAREDSSDDERNFKRRWGRRSSVTVDSRN